MNVAAAEIWVFLTHGDWSPVLQNYKNLNGGKWKHPCGILLELTEELVLVQIFPFYNLWKPVPQPCKEETHYNRAYTAIVFLLLRI